MDSARLAEIEARAKAATEGPWFRKTPNSCVYNISGGIEWEVVGMGSVPDHDFIAHARQDIPDLIVYVRELESSLSVYAGHKFPRGKIAREVLSHE